MDRQFIRDNQIIERYLQGNLADDQVDAFEEACLYDAELRAELRRVESMRGAFRDLDAAGELDTGAAGQPKPTFWTSPVYATAATIALALSVGLSGALFVANQNLRSGAGVTADLVPVSRVVPMASTRGVAAEIVAPGVDEFTVLVVDTAFANYEEYRVLITRERDGSGALVVEREGLHSANNAVGIALPGRLLIPGEYTIELSGIVENADGVQFEPVVSASLSVVTAPE